MIDAASANEHHITKVYVAGPLFTDVQREVGEKIRAWLDEDPRFEYFLPLESSSKIWKGRAPKDCSQADRDQVFQDNWSNIEWADVLVAWVGGMDSITNAAGNNLVSRIYEDSMSGTPYPGEIDGFLEAYNKEYKPAPPDIGTGWEMGFAFGTSTDVLAYIDETDKRQSMNLMLELGVQGVAKGFDQLKSALERYHMGGELASESKLEAETESVG